MPARPVARVRAETTSMSAHGAMEHHALLAVERPSRCRARRAWSRHPRGRSARPLSVCANASSACPPPRRAGSLSSAPSLPPRATTARPARSEIGLDHERLAERFHHGHHVDRAAAEAAVLRGERQPEQAQLGKRRPDVAAAAVGARRRSCGAPRSRSPLARNRRDANPPAVAALRCSRSSCTSPHSPSAHLAMMLRWISLEPA